MDNLSLKSVSTVLYFANIFFKMLPTEKNSEKFYTQFPQILEDEKIIVEKIVSDDDTLDSLYSKLAEGKQWK